MIREFTRLLGSIHGEKLTFSDKAEVLTRLRRCTSSQDEEARSCAEIVIGFPGVGKMFSAGKFVVNMRVMAAGIVSPR